MWYLTPGRSLTLPPLIRTTLCSCKLCPTPPIYAVTSNPFVSLTLATFLQAELGFFGVVVLTTVQTPLLCGHSFNAGAVDLLAADFLPFLTNWLIVGIFSPPEIYLSI